MFNLDECYEKYMLQNILRNILSGGINKSTDILNGETYTLQFVSKEVNPTKYSKAVFYSNKTLKTSFSFGKEGYFAPMSVIAYLQYIINNLPEKQLKLFEEYLIEHII